MAKEISYPARININFALPAEIEEYVVSLNRLLMNVGFNEIRFSGEDAHIPHITLLMGDVATHSHYEALVDACRGFAVGRDEVPYNLTKPYWKQPSRRFVFIDTVPLERFRTFRKQLDEFVRGLIECEQYGGPENPSHITVGYSDIRKFDLSSIAAPHKNQAGVGSVIRICRAGSRGTCIEVLEEILLGGARIAQGAK